MTVSRRHLLASLGLALPATALAVATAQAQDVAPKQPHKTKKKSSATHTAHHTTTTTHKPATAGQA